MMPTSMQRDGRTWAKKGLLGYASEAYCLLAAASDVESKVRATLESVETMKARVRRTFGKDLSGLRVLDVGPGPQLGRMRCLARDNDVVGIDVDVVPDAPSVRDYVDLLMTTSPTRVVKTVVRKAAGIDRRFLVSLSDHLGKAGFPEVRVHRMDPTCMELEGASFDFVYSCAAFAHLARPEAALEEVRRVLAPGGVAYVSLRLYTSHAGQHDPRLLLQARPEPPFWPHLRPEHAATVARGTRVNKVRLRAWEDMFARVMPGARFSHERCDRELASQLRLLRAAGELTRYGDDELLTANVVALWQKPAQAG